MIYFSYGFNHGGDEEFHITVGETHREAMYGTGALCGATVCDGWLGDAGKDHPDAYICEECVMELAKRASAAGKAPRLVRTPRPLIEPPV